MSHIQYVDELVREYLMFRGFSTTLKSYDNELKTDKDRGFRVDKVIDQIMHYIASSDLQSLRDLWAHMDSLLFSKLEQHFTPAMRKLEQGVLRFYLVTAITNNRTEKVNEFYAKLTPELQSQPEWKEWFILPFIKNPEDNPVFSVCFTKQWQDTLFVSLHNFLATVFQCMPQPTLSGIESEASLLKKLQEENLFLRNRLTQSQQHSPISNFNSPQTTSHQSRATTFQSEKDTKPRSPKPILNINDIVPIEVPPPTHIVDDFYIIAQENISGHMSYYSDNSSNQARGLKSLIRNIGASGSPVMGRKETTNDRNKKRSESVGRTWTHT